MTEAVVIIAVVASSRIVNTGRQQLLQLQLFSCSGAGCEVVIEIFGRLRRRGQDYDEDYDEDDDVAAAGAASGGGAAPADDGDADDDDEDKQRR